MSDVERPNIVLLLTDQERYDVSAAGGPDVDTRNIDRLKDGGVQFENAYTPVGICSSARASLMTGLYPHNTEVVNNTHEPDAVTSNLPTKYTTFSELLAKRGYYNSYIGKWHLGRENAPDAFRFHHFRDRDERHVQSEHELEERLYTVGPTPEDRELIAAKTTVPISETRPYRIAQETIEHLERLADGGADAFFHRTDFPGPHHPYVVPEPYASKYDPADIDPWSSFDVSFDDKPRVHEEYRRYRGVDHMDDWADWAPAVAKYFGFVDFIDDQIGRILDALADLGLDQETVIVHAADHGDFTGSYRQFNKGAIVREETYHIPLQIRWPGVTDRDETSARRACHEYVRLLDLMPTFLEMADVPVPDAIDGRSLVPLLWGKTPDNWPEGAFLAYYEDEFTKITQRAWVTDEYKYVFNGPNVDELYDRGADPHELENVIESAAYADVEAEMKARLLEQMERTRDPRRKWAPNALGVPRDAAPEAAAGGDDPTTRSSDREQTGGVQMETTD